MRLIKTAVLAFACGVLAACANTAGGSSMPAGQLPQLQNPVTASPAPTTTPGFVTGLLRVPADGSAVTIPAPGDFKVSAAFAPTSTSSASPAPSPSPMTLNATVSVPGPAGIPAYGATLKKRGLFGTKKELGPVLLYVWFESDKNMTLGSLPTLDFSIPLPALEPYGTDPDIRLAIDDPANE